MTYDAWLAEFEELSAEGYHAAADCLAQEYSEYYETYTDSWF